MKSQTKISVVVPIYNEQKNIKPLKKSLDLVLKKFKSYEVIWVDDGSTDSSLDVITRLIKKDSKHILIQLRRNFGQTAALSAGFDHSVGDIIVTLDGDLQNDPKDILKLVKLIEFDDYDLVTGWRQKRKDNLVRLIFSQIANWLINQISGLNIHDFGCTLKAYRSDLIKEIRLYGEMHRFIPAIASQIGAKIIEVPVTHHPRKFGVSKYGLGRTFRVMSDIILVKFLLSFQNRPLHLFGSIGLLSTFVGSVTFTYLVMSKIIYGLSLSNRPLFLISILLILVGVQFITFGILSEMIMRVYYESQDKKPYLIRQVISSKIKK